MFKEDILSTQSFIELTIMYVFNASTIPDNSSVSILKNVTLANTTHISGPIPTTSDHWYHNHRREYENMKIWVSYDFCDLRGYSFLTQQ